MAKTITVDIDRGRLAILKQINVLKKKPFVKVGLMGGKIHKRAKTMTVAQVGFKHEFGAGRIPQRSFMRTTFDEKKNEWFRETKKVKDDVLRGKETVSQGLDKLGKIIANDTKSKIIQQDPRWPELSPITIAKKGSSIKLIETSQMLNEIKHKKVMQK